MEEVLNYIKQNKNINKKKLLKSLSYNEEELTEILQELQNELKIELTRSNTYEITEKDHKRVGKLSLTNKGYGFVHIKDKDIYVSKKNLNGALDEETVLIDIFKDEQNRDYGVVLKRKIDKKKIVGTIINQNNEIKLILDHPKYQHLNIDVPSLNKYSVDYKVLVETDGKTGKIVEILGHKNDPGMDILSVVKEIGLSDTFPKEVINETKNIPNEVREEEYKDRVDLREDVLFTIDGEGAKDFDDAVGIKKLENGNYLLTVSIADVAHYVKENSSLDNEAKLRGCSVYLTDRVIPMLPHKLSNGICSLNEGVDRLTLSCQMEFNPKGKLKNYDIFESVINSKKRMKYHEVNEVLEGKENEEYRPFIEELKHMVELSHILRENREKRGSISFDTNEIKIIVDENGKAIDVEEEVRGESEKIIEDFMIAANEVVATYATYMSIPFIYRIHDLPDSDKLKVAKEMIKTMGFKLKSKDGNFNSKQIQSFLLEVHDEEEYDVIADILLKAMKKAVYSIYNDGHFALASPRYSHFTSPIRRYPDLEIHRVLKSVLKNEIDYDCMDKLTDKLNEVALLSSQNEQKAEQCEREVDKLKSAEYLEDKIGSLYEGKIVSMNERGMYVKLKNQIEGFIPSSSFHSSYDIEKMFYKDEEEQKIYKLGSNVTVKLVKADKAYRIIDFEFPKIKQI